MPIVSLGLLGSASASTAGTTLTIVNTTGAIIPIGTFLHITSTWDNIASVTPPVISVDGPGISSGTFLHSPAVGSGVTTTAGSGIWHQCWQVRINVDVAVGATIAILTSNQSAVKRAAHAMGWSGSSGFTRGTVATGVSTTGVPTVTTAGNALVVGDLVIGSVSFENNAQMIADADTAGGSWSAITGTFTTGGGAAANVGTGTQFKVVTATGTQTFNPTGGVADTVACVYSLQPEPPFPAITQSAYGFYSDSFETGALADGYDETNYTGVSYTVARVADLAGQSFIGNGGALTSAGFWARTSGTPTGSVWAEIYAHTGVYGSDTGTGTGSPLATSATRAYSSLTGSFQWEDFIFDGTFTLVAGTPYVVVMRANTWVAGNCFLQGCSTNPPTHAGGRVTYNGTAWSGSSITDTVFRVYTNNLLVPQNTAYSADLSSADANLQVRVMLQSKDQAILPNTDDFQLQYEKNASGTWVPVTTSSSAVAGFNSANLTDGAPTISHLTGGTGGFVPGKVSEDGTVDNLSGFGTNQNTELLYPITLKKADLVNGDTVRFRVVDSANANPVFTYTQTPTIWIGLPALTQAAYRFYAEGTEAGSTALAAQNTASTVDLSAVDVSMHLRVLVQSTNVVAVPAAASFQLQYERNASGTWTNVALAAEVISNSYSESNYAGVALALNANADAYAQSFLGDGSWSSHAEFWISRTGSPDGTVRMALFAHSGVFGSATAVPTGPELTGSSGLTSSTISTSNNWVSGTLTNPEVLLQGGVPYFVAVLKTGTSVSPDEFSVPYDQSAPTHPGSGTQRYLSNWLNLDGDLIFRIYTRPLSAFVGPFNSPNLTDGAATTNRLTGGTGTFAAGEVAETGFVSDLGWSGNNYTELLFPIIFRKADLTNGDTVRFRVLRNGVTTGWTYTAIPTMTVATAPTVTATLATSWNVRAGVTTTLAESWNVRAPVGPVTSAQSWNVRTPVVAALVTSWNVRAAAVTSLAQSWNVRALVTLASSTTWNVLSSLAPVATKWLHHVAIAAPPNGTAGHTISSASGTAVIGSLFTPAAGSKLVAFCEGSVTSGSATGVPANPPTGWTKPSGVEAVSNSGLYVWERTASGTSADQLVLVHNGTDYAIVVEIFEFQAGTTVDQAASAVGVSQTTGANPALSGLTTSNLILRAAGKSESSSTASAHDVTWGTTVELVDTYTPQVAAHDGYQYGLAYDDVFSGSTAPVVNATLTGGLGNTTERLTVALTAVTPSVTATLVSTWNVRAAVGTTLVQTWSVRTVVGQVLVQNWNIRVSVGTTLVQTWNIRVLVATSVGQSWSVRALVGKTVIQSWAVRTTVLVTLSETWVVRTLVGKTLVQNWNVRVAVGPVLVAQSWTVRSFAGVTLVQTWNIRASVGKTLVESWNVRFSVALTLAQTWTVRAFAGVTLAQTWTVRAFAGVTLAQTWNIRAVATVTLAQTWNIRTVVAVTLAQAWRVRAGITGTLANSWVVRASITGTLANSWVVRASITGTLANSWVVRASVAVTLAQIWNVRVLVAATLAQAWQVRAGVTGTLTSSWVVRASLTAALITSWNVRSASSAVLSLLTTSWNVRTGVTAALVASWNVRVPVGPVTLVTSWNVRSGLTITLAGTWRVRAGLTITLVTSWNVLTTSTTAGWPKVWTGTAWVQKPVKAWNGSAWVPKPMKVWSGTAWTPVGH